MTQSTQKRSLVAIVTMFFIFAMISFVTNMAAPFGNIWGFKYEWAGMAGNLMNFTAYLFMGIPAGNMLIRYGYKKTALIALAVGAIGLGIQLLSSVVGGNVVVIGGENPTTLNLFIYLLGALVCGFCVCMLNTVVNPMLNLLGGGGNKGNQLVQAGGTLNSLSGTLTPLLVGMLVGTLTKETTMAAVAPLVTTGIVIFVVAFIIISFIRIQEPQANLKQVKYEHSPLAFRHCLLGVIAIFFYVGIEIGIPGELNAWISRENFEGAAAVAGSLAALYWLMMLIGRFLSTIISGKVSTRAQMITVSSVAILLVLIAIFLPEDITFKSPEIAALNIMSGQVPLKCLFPLPLRSLHFSNVGRYLQSCDRGIGQVYGKSFRSIHDDGCRRRYHAVHTGLDRPRTRWRNFRLYQQLLAGCGNARLHSLLFGCRLQEYQQRYSGRRRTC